MTARLWRIAALAAAATAALAVPAGATQAELQDVPSLERSIVAEINAVRRGYGLPLLRASGALARAADGHSRAMATLGFFGHSSRDGTAFWKRIARSYPRRGYAYWTVGENLLWSSSELDARAAVRMWLRSPPHRKVLLSRSWRELGISAVRASAAPGYFAGSAVTVVTADFGQRR